MKVIIYGPNLADQSRGSFVVHRDGCGDRAPLALGGAPSSGWAIEADSKAEAVIAIYSDILAEQGDYEACRSDVHFSPCLDGLAEGSAAELLEEEAKGAEDHARASAEEHVLEMAGVLGEFSALMSTGMEATFNAYSEQVSRMVRMIAPAAMLVRQAAGPDDGPNTGVLIDDMPPDLLLDNAKTQPLTDAVQAAGEYTIYLNAHSTGKMLAGLLEAIGQDVGLDERAATARFVSAYKAMRERLADEGIARKGGE